MISLKMQKKIIALLVFVILLSSFSHALDTAQIKQGIEQASEQVNDFFSNTTRDEITIVTGSKISIEDKILFNMLKSQVTGIQGIEVDPDTKAVVSSRMKNVVLIGGGKTNLLSKIIMKDLKDKKETVISPLVLVFGKYPDGRKAMIIYSQKEINNNENSAVLKSPLAAIMDKKYVPVAATFISILLLYFWSILGKIVMSLFSDFSSSKVMQNITSKKKIKKKEVHHLKLHEFIDFSEIIALLITSIVFAVTMSWTWSGNLKEFQRMFVINLIIVAVISFLREITRQFICYKNKLRTEYSLWPFGGALTLISTFLGNTFSLVSYTLVDENINEKKFGKITFMISLFTFIAAVIAYILNIFNPGIILQMIFVYCIMMLFIDLFPLAPFAGNDIRKWKFVTWLIFYIIVIVSYIYVNFTAYV
jgi:hypothetical protein